MRFIWVNNQMPDIVLRLRGERSTEPSKLPAT